MQIISVTDIQQFCFVFNFIKTFIYIIKIRITFKKLEISGFHECRGRLNVLQMIHV